MSALEDKRVQLVVGGVGITGGIYVAVKLSWFRKNPFKSFGGKTGVRRHQLSSRYERERR